MSVLYTVSGLDSLFQFSCISLGPIKGEILQGIWTRNLIKNYFLQQKIEVMKGWLGRSKETK